jgi:hypothetical protein
VLGSRSPIKIQGQNLDSQYSYQKKERPMWLCTMWLKFYVLSDCHRLVNYSNKKQIDILNIIKVLLMELSFCLAPF